MERINQKVRSKQISWNVIDARFLWKRRSFVRNFRFLFRLLDRIEFTFHDIPIFLPFYVTKFTRKITKSLKFSFTQYPLPRLFFLEKLSRELSIYLRRIFANLRSVLIRGNRLPVKVISSDDGKTDFSSNWHHSRRGGNTRVRSTTNWDATCTTCPSGRGLRRLGRQRCFRAPLWWPVAQAHPAPRNLTAGGPAPV